MRLWRWPLAIALLTASGLVSALVSDGWGDVWSWLALGLPVSVMATLGLGRPARATEPACFDSAPTTPSIPPTAALKATREQR